MIPAETLKICIEYDIKLNNIKRHILECDRLQPFTFDMTIINVLKPDIIDAIGSYEPKFFVTGDKFGGPEYGTLIIKDLIKCYYDISSIKDYIKRSKRTDYEAIFTSHEWYGKMFKVMRPNINFKGITFFIDITAVQTKIHSVLKTCGLNLPLIHIIKEKLIQYYLDTKIEKKPFLIPLKDLTVNDTLYIINHVHGGVKTKNDDGKITAHTVDIPDTMNFYRIMPSEYSAVSCTTPLETLSLVRGINEILKIKRKNTHRNNIKIIESVIGKILRKTKAHMTDRKVYGMAGSESAKKRYSTTKPHVHFFKESKMILKQHFVYLFNNDLIDRIYIANPQIDINLLDYIDIKIDSRGVITFNTADLMNVIQSIKYVLFIDLSCSSSITHNTNKELNNFKALAEKTEGSSITQKMALHLNLSPYNKSYETKSLNRLTSKSKKSKTEKSKSDKRLTRSLNRSLGKSRRYKNLV